MSVINVKTAEDLLLEAKDTKYAEIWAEYDKRVSEVEHGSYSSTNPQKGQGLSKKSDKRLTKKSKGQSLTTQEEADEEWYDEYLDWADDNHDAADLACDAVELMTNQQAVSDYDVVNTPAWTTFIAP